MNDLTQIPKPNKDVFTQEVDNEVLILDRNDNKIHQLNTTASLIWKKCNGSNPINSIIKSLIHDFDISPEEAEKDVLDAIRVFQKNNLLE